VQSTQRTSPRELEALRPDGAVTVIDVRGKGDRACDTIPKAIEIALADLRGRMHAIPTDKPNVVHSAAGGRSSTAASLLRANGLADVSDLTGGFAQWEPGTPTKTAKPRNTANSSRRASATQPRRKTAAKR
jgi:hydroxyacylglutathione hydrolase